jgi:hypothetical protein
MEPNVIVYPAQHGIRKHGRWNSRSRHVKEIEKHLEIPDNNLDYIFFS